MQPHAEAMKKLKGTKLPQVALFEETDTPEILKVNECVLINPEAPSGSGLPFIGKVVNIVKTEEEKDVQLQVNWFYRPEEAVGGRKAFHGEKELFLSDHFDKCSVKTVMAKCRVLSLSRYQELAHIEENDFFARFTYRPAQRIFEPPKVPVFCICEMPYNPDKFMVQCDQCTEWYHPECLKTSRKALKSQSNWRCPDCLKHAQLQLAGATGIAAAAAQKAAAGARDDGDGDAAQQGRPDKRRKTAE